jgi:hypothetical protein
LAHSALFSVLASFPFIAWVGRNLWFADNAVNRTFGFHPPAFSDMLHATDTIGYWFFPSEIVDTVPWISRYGLLLVLVFFCWLVVKVGFPRSRYLQMVSVCPVGYLVFLLISRSWWVFASCESQINQPEILRALLLHWFQPTLS